jgi:adenosylhomocysteine nucleosidase
VIRCGPGKVAAAAAAQAAVQYLDPALLVNFGTAGCPDTSVDVGTLAVAGVVFDVALTELGELPVKIPDRFQPDPQLTSCLLEVPGTRESNLMCWEGHVTSPLRRPTVTGEPGLITVVDWESAAVAQVAQMWEVPWAALKVVSDHGEPERLRLLALVAKRPLQWGAEVMRRACEAYAGDRAPTHRLGEAKEGTA